MGGCSKELFRVVKRWILERAPVTGPMWVRGQRWCSDDRRWWPVLRSPACVGRSSRRLGRNREQGPNAPQLPAKTAPHPPHPVLAPGWGQGPPLVSPGAGWTTQGHFVSLGCLQPGRGLVASILSQLTFPLAWHWCGGMQEGINPWATFVRWWDGIMSCRCHTKC